MKKGHFRGAEAYKKKNWRNVRKVMQDTSSDTELETSESSSEDSEKESSDEDIGQRGEEDPNCKKSRSVEIPQSK